MDKMGFRWYGPNDPITLEKIRQIPGTDQIVGALWDVPVGEVWPESEIKEMKEQVENAGLKLEVIESVNVHDDIKIGLPDRDKYIENYIQTIRNLSKYGIKVICYNFMAVFDWMRTDLHYQLTDGSRAMRFKINTLKEKHRRKLLMMFKKLPVDIRWQVGNQNVLHRLRNYLNGIKE